jgi:hypothetical protein
MASLGRAEVAFAELMLFSMSSPAHEETRGRY